MLPSHDQSGAESIAAYATSTTDVCFMAYASVPIETQLPLAVDHLIGGMADAVSRDYLLNDRACSELAWQKTVQMA